MIFIVAVALITLAGGAQSRAEPSASAERANKVFGR